MGEGVGQRESEADTRDASTIACFVLCEMMCVVCVRHVGKAICRERRGERPCDPNISARKEGSSH